MSHILQCEPNRLLQQGTTLVIIQGTCSSDKDFIQLGVGITAIVTTAYPQIRVGGGDPILEIVTGLTRLGTPAPEGSAEFTFGALGEIDRAGHGIDIGVDADAAQVLCNGLGQLGIIDIAVVGG